ncbi:MAG: asparaginyl-tRNA synthetase [Thermoplasmata archaeon]|jgi:asparaginyl-tRNA synthetase|nr:asparaginyl-tRNA synthetase [Thermoplasmata archaeon]
MTWDAVADVLAGRKTGQTVRLRGWVHRSRSAGKMAFIVLRDGSGGVVQCTVKGGAVEDKDLEAAKSAGIESSVQLLEGTVVADERAPGGFEVKATRFELHRKAEAFPLRGEQGTEFELDNRHLWLRSTELSAILRVKGRLYKAIRDFYAAEGFVEVDPSVITTNACEGGSTLFTFDYFGQTAYLSQSAQMYLEGCIFGIPKVFSITPSFRAEKSRTNKHLTEFHHLEAEYAWWDAEDNRVFQERMVTHLAHTVAKECEADLRLLGQDPAKLLRIGTYEPGKSLADEPGKRFPRVDYAAAVEELQRQGFHLPYGEDFGVPHEKALTEGRVNPMFICDWPARIKAFYMAEKQGTDRVLCSDMLGPDGYGEIIGGSQRSEDIESMKRRLSAQLLAEAAEKAEEQHKKLDFGILDGTRTVGTPAEAEAFFQAVCELTGTKFTDVTVEAMAGSRDRSTPRAAQDAWTDAYWKASLAPYQWYFDLRRYGSVPHSGFGLGIERLLRWFTGQEHIRDMLPYPRTPSRAYP